MGITTIHPLPWTWKVPDGMDEEYIDVLVPVDFTRWKSIGYIGNPQLYDANNESIISAGDGEYTPYDNPLVASFIEEACNNYESVCEELAKYKEGK